MSSLDYSKDITNMINIQRHLNRSGRISRDDPALNRMGLKPQKCLFDFRKKLTLRWRLGFRLWRAIVMPPVESLLRRLRKQTATGPNMHQPTVSRDHASDTALAFLGRAAMKGARITSASATTRPQAIILRPRFLAMTRITKLVPS